MRFRIACGAADRDPDRRKPAAALRRPSLLLAWLVGSVMSVVLMMGVPTNRWGGLPVSLMVMLAGVLGSMPLGVLLALDRRARALPFIRFDEALRGGVQGLPAPQEEAGRALGLSCWKAMWLVILAVGAAPAIPPLVNTVISS